MFRFLSRHRLFFDMLVFIGLVFTSILYMINEKKPSEKTKWDLIIGSALGLMAIFKLNDIINGFKKKRQNRIK